MKKTLYTKDGIEKRELTKEEFDLFVLNGDEQALKEVTKQNISKAVTDSIKLNIVLEFLKLK